MVLVAATMEEGREIVVAIGSYSRIPNTDMAEVALLVRDDWQNRGLGTTLFRCLAEIALKYGVEEFTAWVMKDNDPMMHIFRRSRYQMKYGVEGDLYHVNLKLKNP
jgi:L-amino acid N-acyltransferase YncA